MEKDNENKTCPECGGIMKMDSGEMKCEDCGHIESSNESVDNDSGSDEEQVQ